MLMVLRLMTFSKVNNYFKEGKKNTIDGLKITWQEKWVHLRASNTEPIIRIYAEAPIKKEAEELLKKANNINLVGNESIAISLNLGIGTKQGVKIIDGVPFLIIIKM